jgi:peptidyl-tRNA hydrolase
MFAVGLASYKIKPSQPTCFWIGPTPTEQLDRSGDIREL